MTGWAMLGFEAAGINPQDVTSGKGVSPVEYLQEEISTVQSPGDLARTILALEGAGIEPREFGGRNLVAALLAKRRPDGSYEDWPNSTAYAVVALRSAGIANVADSVEWLREAQNEDGGWGDVPGSPSNADGTGAVLQALSPSSKAAQRAVGYLRQVQQPGGGYRLGGNGALNTQSTAWAVEGLLAAGADPAQFKRGGKSAYEYLEDNQASDGHYRYSSKSDQTPVWVTGQVMVAASEKYLPLEAAPRAPKPKTPKPTPTPPPTPEPLPLPEPVTGGAAPAPNPTPVFPAKGAHGAKSQGGKKGGQSGKHRQGGGAKTGGVAPSPGEGGGGDGATGESARTRRRGPRRDRRNRPARDRRRDRRTLLHPRVGRSRSEVRLGFERLRLRLDRRRPDRRLRPLRPRLLPLSVPAEEARRGRAAAIGSGARDSSAGRRRPACPSRTLDHPPPPDDRSLVHARVGTTAPTCARPDLENHFGSRLLGLTVGRKPTDSEGAAGWR